MRPAQPRLQFRSYRGSLARLMNAERRCWSILTIPTVSRRPSDRRSRCRSPNGASGTTLCSGCSHTMTSNTGQTDFSLRWTMSRRHRAGSSKCLRRGPSRGPCVGSLPCSDMSGIGVQPTCRDSWTDAFDSIRTLAPCEQHWTDPGTCYPHGAITKTIDCDVPDFELTGGAGVDRHHFVPPFSLSSHDEITAIPLCLRHRRATSADCKAVSKQRFQIFPKIVEIDLLLQRRRELIPRVIKV
jgi:hypothetical protein